MKTTTTTPVVHYDTIEVGVCECFVSMAPNSSLPIASYTTETDVSIHILANEKQKLASIGNRKPNVQYSDDCIPCFGEGSESVSGHVTIEHDTFHISFAMSCWRRRRQRANPKINIYFSCKLQVAVLFATSQQQHQHQQKKTVRRLLRQAIFWRVLAFESSACGFNCWHNQSAWLQAFWSDLRNYWSSSPMAGAIHNDYWIAMSWMSLRQWISGFCREQQQ